MNDTLTEVGDGEDDEEEDLSEEPWELEDSCEEIKES